MKGNYSLIVGIAVLVAALLVVAWKLLPDHGVSATEMSRSPSKVSPNGRASTASRLDSDEPQGTVTGGKIDPRLATLTADFGSGVPATLEESLARYARLDTYFHELVKRESESGAAAIIGAYLLSGADAAIGLPMRVGYGSGIPEFASTVRVYLLNKLHYLDPEAALVISRGVIQGSTSQDESALALRSIAGRSMDTLYGERSGETLLPGGVIRDGAELDAAFIAVMSNARWREEPGDGYLNSFDIAVANPSEVTVGQVLEIANGAGNTNEDARAKLQNAATIALDEIMLRRPELILTTLLEKPSGFLAGNPALRAQVMSRVDVSTEIGASAVSAYLNGTAHGEGELDSFLAAYPNGNTYVGDRLASQTTGQSPHSIYITYEQSYANVVKLEKSAMIPKEYSEKMKANLSNYFPSEE